MITKILYVNHLIINLLLNKNIETKLKKKTILFKFLYFKVLYNSFNFQEKF